MILGHNALATAFKSGTWAAYRGNTQLSLADLAIGPNSIDVTLHPSLLVPQAPLGIIDPFNPDSLTWSAVQVSNNPVIYPGQFRLGAAQERFNCDAPLVIDGQETFFAPMYDGRSTLGRLGIGSHVTAGFGDYGFKGSFTLELFNVNSLPVKLHEGMRIGQVFFVQVAQPGPYTGAYSKDNHFNGPVAPVLGQARFQPKVNVS